MAIITQLSVTALPGKPHSFLAKDPATPESGPHTGLFTELSATATPGVIHSFVAKDEAAAPAVPHTGLFTALSVTATPGAIHSFLAKEAAAVIAEVEGGRGNLEAKLRGEMLFPYPVKHHPQIIRDDMEIIELIGMILNSEVLD